jgi:heptosyltransferase-2
MSTPALCAVRESFPAAEITLLANPLVAQLFSPHPAVDRVLTFDRNGKHRGIAGRFRLAAELRRQGFDLAVILPNSFDSAAVPFLAGIPKRIGKSSDGRGFLLTDRCVPGSIYPPRHEVDYYLELLRCFGIRGSETIPCLTVTTAEEQAASSLLSEQGIQSSDIVLGINPGATFGSAKRWYPDRFAEAARRLAEEWSARTVIFGSGGEAPLAAEIERELGGGCVNMAGKTSVRELMALIKRCNFLITNDSGPMHIGAAFGVPLVAVFGPTDHTGTAPFSDRAVIVRKEMDCAPCKLRQCPTDHTCMTAITADDVIRAALDLAHRTGVGRS